MFRAELTRRLQGGAIPLITLAGLLAGTLALAEDPDGRFLLCEAVVSMNMLSGPGGWIFDKRSEFRSSYPVEPAVMDEFARLLEALQARGITVVMVVVPERSTVFPGIAAAVQPPVAGYDHREAVASYRALQAWLGEQGVVTVDLLTTARNAELPEPFFLHRERHMTVSGSRAAAQVVAQAIQQTPAYSQIPKTRWETVPHKLHDPLALRPDAAYQQHCGSTFPPISHQQYRARPVDRSKRGLLDEVPAPPVVLVGTSHSGPLFNFPAFLQEALGAEILAVRVEGGGILSSLRRWLGSTEHQQSPPKVLVWEFPINDLVLDHRGRLGFTSALSYRRLIPAVSGPCGEEEALASGSVRGGGRMELLQVPLESGPVGHRDYLTFETASRALSTFRVIHHFADGSTEIVVVPATPSIPSDGRFFLELSPDYSESLRRVEVILPDDFDDTLSARVCRAPAVKR